VQIGSASDERRQMLAEWYLASLRRHGAFLTTERVRRWIRVRGRSYYVTGSQLQAALDATYAELDSAISNRLDCGADADGSASEIAIVGLAQRRLQARLIDEIRRGKRRVEVVDLSAAGNRDGSRHEIDDDAPAHLDRFVLTELRRESKSTQAVILLTAGGYSAPEISSRLGMSPSAVRQRVSRFGKRLRSFREAA
jgi:DNA-directed RNA polymerase specialized sigma24 family protein